MKLWTVFFCGLASFSATDGPENTDIIDVLSVKMGLNNKNFILFSDRNIFIKFSVIW